MLDVAHQRVGELGLDVQAHLLGGPHDRTAELDVAHGADEHVVGGEQVRELRIGRAAPVVVGADREHHDVAVGTAAQVRELPDEARALALVAAEGERLLELVDGDHAPAVAVEPGG